MVSCSPFSRSVSGCGFFPPFYHKFIRFPLPAGVEDLLDEDEAGEIEDAPDLVRMWIRIHQARTFIDRAALVINAGRSDCPFCGLPINVDGHLCPRANGYRR